ncbi:EH domain-containing protein 1-like protein [Tanacetum coccineum]
MRHPNKGPLHPLRNLWSSDQHPTQQGTFVCGYVGEIVTNTELLERIEQSKDAKHRYPVLLDAVKEAFVWAIADSRRQGYLGFKEFITAMQLISLAQAGQVLRSDILQSDVDFEYLHPPTLDGLDGFIAVCIPSSQFIINNEAAGLL